MIAITEIITVSHDDELAEFYSKLKEYPDEWVVSETTVSTTYKRTKWIDTERKKHDHKKG